MACLGTLTSLRVLQLQAISFAPGECVLLCLDVTVHVLFDIWRAQVGFVGWGVT